MRILFVVHGVIQGIGYRAFVKGIADRHMIKGAVRNVSNGTVEILAIGDERALEKFEKDINIYEEHGPKVFHLEKMKESDKNFPKNVRSYANFVIEDDRTS